MKDVSTRVMVFAFPTVHSRYPALDAPPTSFTQKPDALRDGKERFEQRVAELFELGARLDLHLTGAASRDYPEVGELELSVTMRPVVASRQRSATRVPATAITVYVKDGGYAGEVAAIANNASTLTTQLV